MSGALTILSAVLALQGSARSWVLIVSGAGGEPQYSESFYETGKSMAVAARERFGLPDSAVIYLAEDPARDPKLIAARSTRENVVAAFSTLAARVRPGDQVLILLIGHGSYQDAESRFNLPGPDLSAKDFAKLLARFSAQKVAFIDASSASGDVLPVVSGPGRTIVTATKTGFEGNETRFARYFVAAFTSDVADTDKDGRVSILEAFDYARREVARSYEAENRLLTEHAQLADNGDKAGSREPDGKTAGALARTFALARGGAATGALSNDPGVAELQRAKDSIDARIAALRARKAQMDSTAYDQALEKLLVELATKNQAIREMEKKKP